MFSLLKILVNTHFLNVFYHFYMLQDQISRTRLPETLNNTSLRTINYLQYQEHFETNMSAASNKGNVASMKQLKQTYKLDASTGEIIPGVWQDREIRFDIMTSMLKVRKGEEEIDSINSVEDTKGNNGHRGFLVVTNLRLIWASHKQPTTNLSIGFNCITGISIKSTSSRLRGGTSQALYIMSKFKNGRYEFVFTSLVAKSPRLFTTVQAVSRAYETSKMYRNLKLRGAIIKDNNLLLMPDENVFSNEQGVWNLSSDQGNLGSFYITNIRIVWHANLAHNFNVSIPYLQIRSLQVRKSKFGLALVIETREIGRWISARLSHRPRRPA